MEPTIEGALRSADGYWLVEVVRYGRHDRRYRVSHAATVLADRAVLGTVQRILGDAFNTLQPVEPDAEHGVA